MARTVKKKEQSPEEKLAAALVPEEEQPYKVPGNWCWVRLGSVIEASKEKADVFEEGTKYVGLENIEKDTGVISCQMAESIKSTKTIFHEGDILYGKLRPYLNKHGVVDVDGVCSTDILAFSTKDASLNRYVDFYLHLPNFIESMVANSKGINLPRVSEKVVLNYPIPLAPLSEQQRLVDIISSLFADLDEAKEKLTSVVEGFALRKAAILHRAFTGELTAKWREENGVNENAEEVKISSICYSLKYGTAKKSVPEGNVVVLRMGNLQNGEIDWTNLVYSNDEEDNEKYKLFPGDVLFNRTNSAEWVGKTSIYRGEYPAIYAGYLIKLDYDHDRIIGDFLNYVLNSPKSNEYCRQVKSDGVNQSNINAKKIGAFTFNLPSIDEQREIVRILDDLFEQEQQAQSAVETVLADIDTLKKSILARAFRGELGTGDPEDERAEELVKRAL